MLRTVPTSLVIGLLIGTAVTYFYLTKFDQIHHQTLRARWARSIAKNYTTIQSNVGGMKWQKSRNIYPRSSQKENRTIEERKGHKGKNRRYSDMKYTESNQRHNYMHNTIADGKGQKVAGLIKIHVVFTTYFHKEDSLRDVIHKNTVTFWSSLHKNVHFLDFSDQYDKLNKSPGGIPVLRSMYILAHKTVPDAYTYTYINSDCIGSRKFLDTLMALEAVNCKFLAVGRRSNVQWHKGMIYNKSFDFESVLNKGKLFLTNAQDFFITSENIWDWNHIPPFVIDRPGYDNWLVDYVYHHKDILLIDVTSTTPVIHQTASKGNFEGHTKKLEPAINHKLAAEHSRKNGRSRHFDHGHTHNAVATTADINGKIVVKFKKTVKLKCGV